MAVIVLTMLTQPFAFESIRILEGFWGTSRIAGRAAAIRSEHHGAIHRRLREIHRSTTATAWALAKQSLLADYATFRQELEHKVAGELGHAGSDLRLFSAMRARKLQAKANAEVQAGLAECPYPSPDMLDVLEAAIFECEPSTSLPIDLRMRALEVDWESRTTPGLQQRRISLDKRIRDYPEIGRESPTRLGNIMRRHEDLTGERLIEGFVIREFDSIPFSLQVDHDDQRNRLDLYCTMVFALPVAGLIAALALVAHPGYAWVTFLGASLGSVAAYRAAMATARAYGSVLIAIADHVHGVAG